MKKAILCIVLAMLTLCAGCGAVKTDVSADSTQAETAVERTADDWISMLSSALPFDDQMTLVPENAATVYGIFEDEGYKGDCSLYISTMATPEEIAVFRADDVLSTDDLVARAKSRLETQKASYASYAPQEMPKIDSAVIETVGDFVIVCVCADNAKAAELIRNAS